MPNDVSSIEISKVLADVVLSILVSNHFCTNILNWYFIYSHFFVNIPMPIFGFGLDVN